MANKQWGYKSGRITSTNKLQMFIVKKWGVHEMGK